MRQSRLAAVGSLIGDDTRSDILTGLMDGRARTAGELARLAGVTASTASEHLSKLLEGGMVAVETQGRHRYFRLSGPEIAVLIETIASAAPAGHLTVSETAGALSYARSCYDHLAGRLGVRIYDQMVVDGVLELVDECVHVTRRGVGVLEGIGVDVAELARSRRPMVRTCLDWTERRHHLAGSAGAALFSAFLNHHWVARGPAPRSLRVTRAGREAFLRHLGVEV